jgi:hypothetical protein
MCCILFGFSIGLIKFEIKFINKYDYKDYKYVNQRILNYLKHIYVFLLKWNFKCDFVNSMH